MRFFAIAGALVAGYLLLQPLLPGDPLCANRKSIFACGAAEELIKIPHFRTFNATAGLLAFCYFCWMALRLPRLPADALRPRKLLLIIASCGLGYAIFLRALELFITGKICPWCFLLFLCTLGFNIALWTEWAGVRKSGENLFIPGHFYSNMIKLTCVFIFCSFGGLCAIQSQLPKPDSELEANAAEAGFVSQITDVIKQSENNQKPYLVFMFQKGCIHCHKMSFSLLHEDIQRMIKNIPRARLDSWSRLGQKLFKEHQFNGAPVLALFNARQELVFALSGYIDFETLQKDLQREFDAHQDLLAQFAAP